MLKISVLQNETHFLQLTGLLFLILFFDVRAQSQFPSPMLDHTRAHQRVNGEEFSGVRCKIGGLVPKPVEVYLPQRNLKRDSVRLLIHFHGATDVPIYAVEKSHEPYCLANIQLGSGSAVYENAFSAEKVLSRLIKMVGDSLDLVSGTEKHFSKIYLSAFSAGYGAVRAILSQPNAERLVNGIILLDGLHTDYVPERQLLAEGGSLNTENLKPFLNYAHLAMQEKTRFIITHSEIFPGTYASTTETADYLIQECRLSRKAVLKWGVLGMQQLSQAQGGNFIVLGFAGNSAPDHVDHFHALFHFLDYMN